MKLLDWAECRIAPKTEKAIAAIYRIKETRQLKNRDFSIIAPNCIGGVIYHRLGMQFLSPTINLCIPDKKQYVRFAANLRHYLS